MILPSGELVRQTMLIRVIAIIALINLILTGHDVLAAASGDNLYVLPNCGLAPLNIRKFGAKRGTSSDDLINRTSNSGSESYPDMDADIDPYLDPLSSQVPISGESGYIMNSVEAKYGDWPSMVSLDLMSGSAGVSCGGVIVSEKEIWTAGHCVANIAGSRRGRIKLESFLRTITITAAKHNRRKRMPNQRTYKASSFYLTDKYTDSITGLTHDWARVFLDTPIKFNNYTQPACVRKSKEEVERVSKGACYVVGFGATHFMVISGIKQETYPDTQQYLYLRRVDCRLGVAEKTRMCFSARDNQNRSPCPGDSGSPVLCLDEQSRWNVVAVVSSGPGCDSKQTRPNIGVDVYASVTDIIHDWQG